MIVSLEGVMGSGKSLTATALAYEEYRVHGKKVLSNNHMNFPHQFFDLQYFLDHLQDEEMEDCVLILDEAYLYLDSRTSASKLNKLFTYFTVQTRKRGVDMYICTHHIDIVDKRLRRAIDIRGTCRYRGEDPCKGCEGTGSVKPRKGAKIDVMCPDCEGVGKLARSTNGGGEGLDCPRCQGRGRLEAKGDGITVMECPRCRGNKITGWATTRFLDLRSGHRSRVTVFGPAYYKYYSTEELVPFTQRQVKVSVEDL